MPTTHTKVMSAQIPLPLADKVDALAARLERSRGWVVKQALAAWVDQEEERSRLTREALADVDAGRVIDHQSVQAWADSLDTEHPLTEPHCCQSSGQARRSQTLRGCMSFWHPSINLRLFVPCGLW